MVCPEFRRVHPKSRQVSPKKRSHNLAILENAYSTYSKTSLEIVVFSGRFGVSSRQ